MKQGSTDDDKPLTVEEEIRLTRVAVQKLASQSRWQKTINALIGLAFVAIFLLGGLGWASAANARTSLREEVCRSNRTSALNSRAANEALATAIVSVSSDPSDSEQQRQIKQFQESLDEQQERLLPVPKCD